MVTPGHPVRQNVDDDDSGGAASAAAAVLMDSPPPPQEDLAETDRLRNCDDHLASACDDAASAIRGDASDTPPSVAEQQQEKETVADPCSISEAGTDGDSARVASETPRGDAERDRLAPLDGVVVHEEDSGEDLRALRQEVEAVRSVLACDDAEHGVLEQIRSWRDHRSVDEGPVAQTSARLVPMVPPTGRTADGHAASLVRAVGFDDGVYRGQVKRNESLVLVDGGGEDRQASGGERFVPYGWGIVTSHRGLRRVGRWVEGEQVGVGSLQSAVLFYDGEWCSTAGPCGYGIGTFAFGTTFAGCWHNGRPYGLGRLQSADAKSVVYGWFYGTRCVQSLTTADLERVHGECLQTSLPPKRFKDQPHHGLFLVGQILEDARLSALRYALEQWRRASCEDVLEKARKRRADAVLVWVEAHAAEQDAIAWDVAEQMRVYRESVSEVLQEVAAGRERHKRVQRVREFHTNKLNTAIFQRDLARRCVAAQEESIALMESELAEVGALLEEAKQAQERCKELSGEQQHVKRQIENASVKINALKHEIRVQQGEDQQEQFQPDAARKILKTPVTPAYARAIHGPRHQNRLNQQNGNDSDLPFVCDVPGCSCGIPRDVFLRVASALNGD